MPARKPKVLECVECGRPVVKVPRSDRKPLHPNCAIERMARAAQEMASKRGKAWDSWCASNAAGAPGRIDTH